MAFSRNRRNKLYGLMAALLDNGREVSKSGIHRSCNQANQRDTDAKRYSTGGYSRSYWLYIKASLADVEREE